VHVDYAAEELRIPANMSGDPRMTEIFVNGLDMHEMTAKELFGEENYDRSKRSMAKPFNFGLLYGGTRKMFAPVLGCTEDEAQVYIDKWWNMFSKLKVWADRNVSMAKNRGYVETAFGRRRYTKPEAENPKLRWRVKNIALNSPVQGTGGDLMRLALAKFHRRLVPAYGEDVVRVLSMVHDEVNFSIDPERLVPVCRDIRELMDIRLPGWEVPMVADFEIGYSWGEIYKFELTDEGFVPQGDRVERRSA
jgi:DNA polymerase-1